LFKKVLVLMRPSLTDGVRLSQHT